MQRQIPDDTAKTDKRRVMAERFHLITNIAELICVGSYCGGARDIAEPSLMDGPTHTGRGKGKVAGAKKQQVAITSDPIRT